MLLEPGLHFAFPYPIDEKVFIPLGQQSVKSSVGWYAVTPAEEAAGQEPYAGGSLNPAVDSYTLTADANILHVRATVNYRITEPLKYALRFANASGAVQNAVNNAIVYASSRTKVDQALLDRQAFQDKVLDRVKELIHQQDLGITLDASTVQVIPPRQVKDKFAEVNSADLDRRKTIDNAHSEASRILSQAQSDASSLVNMAEADRSRIVGGLRAEAEYFLSQLQYYTKNPALFTTQLQAATMGRVLTNAYKMFLGRDGQLRLHLNREPEAPQTPQP